MSDRYYNPYYHPTNNVVWPESGGNFYGTVSGHVQDEQGNPLKHVAVKGTSIVAYIEDPPPSNDGTEVYNGYSTFTDQNGNFEIRGFDTDPTDASIQNQITSDRDFAIIDLKIGSYGTEYQQFGFWDGATFGMEQTHTYPMYTFAERIDIVLDGIVIAAPDQGNYEALVSLAANNVVVSGGADLKATYVVDLHDGFHATNGSEVHVYTEPVAITCSDIPTEGILHTAPTNNSVGSGTTKSRNEQFIDLALHAATRPPLLSVFPNPSSGLLLLDLVIPAGSESSSTVLVVRDQLGHEIHRQRINEGRTELDLSGKASGVYQLNVNGTNFNYNRSLVLQ